MSGPVVITGGGTGGHVFPMQAIAEALMSRGVPAERLRYVGSHRGQEASLLGTGPVALTLLPGRGLRRSFAPDALAANAAAVLELGLATATALYLVGRWRPSVVVSVGGYASLAAGLAAVLWRRPLVLVDLDATPSATHRLLAPFAARRCTALPATGRHVVRTGAPLRDAIQKVDRSPAARRDLRRAQDPPVDDERTVIVVMTGSIGSRTVNHAVSELAAAWCEREDLTIVHVTGRRDFNDVVARRPVTSSLDYRVEAFADMSVLWGICDVAVCRAGATTIAELTALGVASVLVPLPGSPSDHQTLNARALKAVGGARLLADAACNAATLATELTGLLDTSERELVESAARSLGRLDGARAIAGEVADVGGLT